MLLKKITFLKNSPFKPHTKPSNKLIRPKLKKLLNKLEYQETPLISKRDKYADIKAVAKRFNVQLKIVPNLKTAGAAYSNRVIIICVIGLNKKLCSPEKIRRIFCHELSHIFQTDVKIWIPHAKYTLAEALQIEQEAESCAMVLYKKFFPSYKFIRNHFKSYFSEADILYLQDYLKDDKIKNDLFLLKDAKNKKS